MTRLLASLPLLSLDPEDQAETSATSEMVLREVVKPAPDRGVVRRGIIMLKGLLAPVASGISKAVTDESADLAGRLIESLGNSLPS